MVQQPSDSSEANPSGAEDTPLLQQYKTLIRQQDTKLQELTTQVEQIAKKNSDLEAKLNESISSNTQLKDENTLLRAQMATSLSMHNFEPATQNVYEMQNIGESHSLVAKEIEIDMIIQSYEEKISVLKEKNSELEMKLNESNTARGEQTAELERLKSDQDDLLELLADQVQ